MLLVQEPRAKGRTILSRQCSGALGTGGEGIDRQRGDPLRQVRVVRPAPVVTNQPAQQPQPIACDDGVGLQDACQTHYDKTCKWCRFEIAARRWLDSA